MSISFLSITISIIQSIQTLCAVFEVQAYYMNDLLLQHTGRGFQKESFDVDVFLNNEKSIRKTSP